MKSSYTLSYVLVLLTLGTLTFLPNTFAQGVLSDPSVRLVYFLPSDRPARPDRIAALRELIKDVQEFYAEQMESHGYGRKTFNIETDANGTPVVHRINGKFREFHYYTGTSDYKIWEELFEHFDDLGHVYFIAADLSQETFNDGDSCGLGSPSFVPSGGITPVFLFTPRSGAVAIRHRDITQKQEVIGGSLIIPASGDCFEDNSGVRHRLRVTTHELGHAFGLDHDFREGRWNNDTVMGGRGFHLSSCAAEWLSVSRFFNTHPISANAPGAIKLLSTPTYSPAGINLQFEVTDAEGLHRAQLIVPENLENGSWGPYRLFDCKRLNGKTSTVEFISPELAIDPVDRVTLQIIDVNGNITWATFLTDIASLLPRPKVVSIPDRNLAAAVRKALGLGANAPVTDQAMQKLTRLDARKSQVKNLTGLEHATRLVELALFHNQIQDVSPLAGLTQLQRLYLQDNRITNITPFAKLTQLRRLHLWGNQIPNISVLGGLTRLESLWLESNQIRDISPLAGLTNLTDLKLNGNPIQDKSPLRTLKARNPKLEIDIEIPPLSAVIHLEAAQRPPMYWVDATTGTLHRLVGDEVENLVPNVKNATSLAVDMASGKLYWTEKTGDRTGRIRGANLDGTNVKLVTDLTSVPHSIALDAANGKLYLANGWGKIQRMDLDGSNFQSNLITGLNAPMHLTLDVAGGKVYWTETAAQSGRIRRANLDGSSVQNVATGLTAPLSLSIASGKVYWASGRRLHRANLDGTNRGSLETLPNVPTGIAFDPARNSLYLTSPSGGIYRRNLDDIIYQSVVTNLASPSNIVLGISAMPPVPTDTPAPPTEPAGDTAADVNQDKKVNKTDLLLVVTALGESPPANPNFDVNADGTVDIADVLLVIEALDDPVAAAAPTLGETVTALDPGRLAMQIDILRSESDGSMKYAHAIAFFQSLLASIRPTETQLLANYPNPFNTETWIPYQLAKASDVKVTIYDGRGVVVRQLVLGYQAPGFYTSRSRAAYWDGRNTLGERVASGIYFYQLQTDNVSPTRKMLILK